MKTLPLLCLIACGGSLVPDPQCTPPVDLATQYPLSTSFDGSKGLPVLSAPAPVEPSAHARVRNAAGNDGTNITQFNVMVVDCEGNYIGSLIAFSIHADTRPGEWQQPEIRLLGLKDFPAAAQVVLSVLPLYAQGQHLVDVEGFEVTP